MKTVDRLKSEIKRLSDSERRALTRWLNKVESEAWDSEMDDDAASGRLQFLVDEAGADRKAGRLRDFP